MNESNVESAEDILSESLAFLGGEPVVDREIINYGPLTLGIAAKEGKANTLLADHLFSPALFFAERIERGLLPVRGSTAIELGAGSGLPSLLLATMPDPPSLVAVTDYPDPNILINLKSNVERNRAHFQPACRVECAGYDWGTDAEALLKLLPLRSQGYEIMILSDLLHFNASHDVLITSIQLLLAKSKAARVHVSAGYYTHGHVCDNFINKGNTIGLTFEEIIPESEERRWRGTMKVSGLDNDALSVRKAACRYWIGHWSETN